MSVASPLTLENALQRVARTYPTREAAVDRSLRLTFAELDEASRRFASLLLSAGAVPREPVLLLTVPSAVHLIAWFGIVRMGGIPVGLHTRESAAKLASATESLSAKVLIYDSSLSELAGSIQARNAQITHLVECETVLSRAQNGPAPMATIPRDLSRFEPLKDVYASAEDDPATIILSSGTTSVAKPIVHSHRSMLEGARNLATCYSPLQPGSRISVPYSTAFLGCYASWLPFLNVGGCSVFIEKFDLPSFLKTVIQERVTHVSLTPTMWRQLFQLDATPETYQNVRQAIFGGEPMDITTLQRIRTIVTTNVAQSYGSSEAFGVACIRDDQIDEARLSSVGLPYLNADVRVVVPGGTPEDTVPRGEAGEIVVSSGSVALGIWNNKELTDKGFITDGARRWWRSGDIARQDHDGFLYLEGRRDDMIISGGINISPNAVEDALRKHPAVVECAVVGMADAQWGEQVHAFVVASDATLDEAALDAFMKASDLSPYQRPRAYHFVKSLPRTATNKLDRKALRSARH